jgi:hypothetical protein
VLDLTSFLQFLQHYVSSLYSHPRSSSTNGKVIPFPVQRPTPFLSPLIQCHPTPSLKRYFPICLSFLYFFGQPKLVWHACEAEQFSESLGNFTPCTQRATGYVVLGKVVDIVYCTWRSKES